MSIRQRSPTAVTEMTSWPHSAALRGTFCLAGAWSTITRNVAPTGICSSASLARTNVNGQTSPVRSIVWSPGDNSIGCEDEGQELVIVDGDRGLASPHELSPGHVYHPIGIAHHAGRRARAANQVEQDHVHTSIASAVRIAAARSSGPTG